MLAGCSSSGSINDVAEPVVRNEELSAPLGAATVIIHDKTIAVELADTPEERIQGLMNRESLCASCGMLFVFQQEGTHGFWMKNTSIPLDLIFINKEGVIVDILAAEPCKEMSCPTYSSQKRALYVLEVNKGMSTQHAFAVGQKVALNLN
ncbi:MAG: DUF192 domain-containing protein [Nanoarchaeota archaeon]